jgi:hypothetical protein
MIFFLKEKNYVVHIPTTEEEQYNEIKYASSLSPFKPL